MKIKGSDITVGTTLRWFVEVGQYYKATHEVTRTVSSIHNHQYTGRKVMTFANEYPQHEWFIDDDKEYETESQGRTWLDGDTNNPL